jgi:hypothetical protein
MCSTWAVGLVRHCHVGLGEVGSLYVECGVCIVMSCEIYCIEFVYMRMYYTAYHTTLPCAVGGWCAIARGAGACETCCSCTPSLWGCHPLRRLRHTYTHTLVHECINVSHLHTYVRPPPRVYSSFKREAKYTKTTHTHANMHTYTLTH